MYGKVTEERKPAVVGPYSSPYSPVQQQQNDRACKVYVGGLDAGTGWEQLRDHLSQAGEVTIARVLGKGTGQAQFLTSEEATMAIHMLNGSELDGSTIIVDAWENRPLPISAPSTQRTGNNSTAPACPYYPLGKCEKGASCKWSHVDNGGIAGGGMGNPFVATKPCPYYPLGKCEKGAECKWSHNTGPSVGGFGSHFVGGYGGRAPATPTVQMAKACPYFPLGKCEKGAACRWVHASGTVGYRGAVTFAALPPQPTYSPPVRICPYYPLGKCEKGSECKWVHTSPAGSGMPGKGGGKACPYYPLGKCEKGSECKWLHVEEIPVAAVSNTPEPKMCPYFPQGRCNKGDECKWTH